MVQADDAAFEIEMRSHRTNGIGIPRIIRPDAVSHMTDDEAASRLARDSRDCMQETGAVRTPRTRHEHRGHLRTRDDSADGGMDVLRQAIRGLWMIRHAI